MTVMDFRQYDQALGRFYGMDVLAEASVYSTPYHYGYNNPVYWSDSSGLLSDSFIGSIWNNSPDKSRTYWENMGGYFVSNHVNAFGNSIATLYDGTIGETLPMMYVDATKGGGGALNYSSEGGFDIGKRIQDHTYRYGKSYQGYRDGLRSAQWDRFQGGLDYAGAIPVLGEPIDMINAAISALRGNYGAAALSAAAMIPVGGYAATAVKTQKNRIVAIANSKAMGNAMEQALGMTNSKTAINVGGRIRFPDRLDLMSGLLEESKNVKHLNLTGQLRDYLNYSQNNGLIMILHTRSTTTFSKPLQQLINNGTIIHNKVPGF